MDTSELYYMDDLLNPCQSVASLQQNFDNLSDRYVQIGLSMNSAKSQVLFSNFHGSHVPNRVRLGHTEEVPTTVLTYLGIPIRSSIENTLKLLLGTTERKPSIAYANIVTSKLN